MTRRKGETTRNRLKREYHRHVAFTLACPQVRGPAVRQYETAAKTGAFRHLPA